MAIGPIGAHIYVNQNMQVQASKQNEFQNRLDMQNAAASQSANDKGKEIREIRPTEETYKIDPEKEHEKEKSEEESGAKEEQIRNPNQQKKGPKKSEEEEVYKDGHLDIKI